MNFCLIDTCSAGTNYWLVVWLPTAGPDRTGGYAFQEKLFPSPFGKATGANIARDGKDGGEACSLSGRVWVGIVTTPWSFP